MTAPRRSNVSTAGTIPPASPIASDTDTRLLKKIHAIRPMLADREGRKKLEELPPRKN